MHLSTDVIFPNKRMFPLYSGVGLSPFGTAATSGLLYKPPMIDEGDCGAIGGMKIGRGNRGTRRKPTPAPLCPPQIPHDQTRARTPDRSGGKPATNRLSYGAAYSALYIRRKVKYRPLVISCSEFAGTPMAVPLDGLHVR
jgi:hypothetical protein